MIHSQRVSLHCLKSQAWQHYSDLWSFSFLELFLYNNHDCLHRILIIKRDLETALVTASLGKQSMEIIIINLQLIIVSTQPLFSLLLWNSGYFLNVMCCHTITKNMPIWVKTISSRDAMESVSSLTESLHVILLSKNLMHSKYVVCS